MLRPACHDIIMPQHSRPFGDHQVGCGVGVRRKATTNCIVGSRPGSSLNGMRAGGTEMTSLLIPQKQEVVLKHL